MVVIPTNLSQWSFEIIKDLVDKGYLESEEFEFKPAIRSRDPDLNNRIVETACAFANTNGGFIIFGVKDTGNRTDDRITGIDKSDDLAKEFGDKIKLISPTVYFDFKNPPIGIPGKNTVLFVVHIFLSSERPHMKTDVGRFYHRTNKGNEFMSYQQTKEAFLRYEERRTKLSLLYIELVGNLTIADEIIRVSKTKIEEDKERFLHFSPLRFETRIISNLLPDIYSVIHTDSQMVESLVRLSLQMKTLNSALSIHQSLKPNEMEFQLDTHNKYIQENINNYTIPLIKKMVQELKSRYEFVNTFPEPPFEIFK